MHSLCPWIIKTCFPPLNAWFCASRSKWITHVRCDWKAVEYYFFGCCQSEYINTNTHFWTFIRSFSRLLPIIATAHQAHQTEPRANTTFDKKDFKLKQCPWFFFLLLCSFLVCCKIRCVVGICDSEWYTHALNSIIRKKHWTERFPFSSARWRNRNEKNENYMEKAHVTVSQTFGWSVFFRFVCLKLCSFLIRLLISVKLLICESNTFRAHTESTVKCMTIAL